MTTRAPLPTEKQVQEPRGSLHTLSQETTWRPSQTEKEVQRAVVTLYRRVGCYVACLSQIRPSRIALGLPDLYVFPPRGLPPFWMEVKRPGGRQSEDQATWQGLCRRAEVAYILGGVDAALDWLRHLGLVAEDHHPTGARTRPQEQPR